MPATVGVRELRNSLSKYLRLAHGGQAIVVCYRGKPIAMLSPLPGGGKAANSMAEHLASLVARGLLTPASRVSRRRREQGRFVKVDLSGAIMEDREDRA